MTARAVTQPGPQLAEARQIAAELGGADSGRGSMPRVQRLLDIAGGKQAAETGTTRHATLASLASGLVDWGQAEFPSSEAESEARALVALLDSVGQILHTEQQCVSWPLGVAGTLDYLLQAPDGRRVVLDFKTGAKPQHLSTAIQCYAYSRGDLWPDGGPADGGTTPRLMCLQAPQDGSPPALYEYDYSQAARAAELAVQVRDLTVKGRKV